MKTNKTIITKSIAGALPIGLLVACLTVGLSTAFARGRGGAAFAEKQPSFAPATRVPATVHEGTFTRPNSVNRRAALNTIESRLARLDARLGARAVTTEDVRLHRDRIARSREFLTGLVELGTPEWEIDAWTDALCQDEIIAGMPSDLVLDYWGNPIASDSIFLAGVPAEVWTYRLRPGRTDRITVADGAVRSVRHR